jgi:YebC/PmpR family DNA-binding regulatory protein
VLVEAVTDNRNRTAADVRHIFAKNDGNLGTSGAVAWLFERKGVILVPEAAGEDEVMLAAAEGGAEDIRQEGSSLEVLAAPDDLVAVRAALDSAGIEVESSQLTMLPKTTVQIEDEASARKLLRLMDALEENDDVQDVYANFDIPEGILEAVV